MKQFIALLALVGLITTSVSSQQPQEERGHQPRGERDQGRPGPHREGPPPPDPIFMLFDTDRDGELSQKEIEQATTILKKRDRDKNGFLTRDELPHPPRPHGERPPHQRGEGPPQERAERPHHPRGERPPHRRGEGPPQERAERPHHPRGEHPPRRRGEGPPPERAERPHHPRGERPPHRRGEGPPQERAERPHHPRGERPPRRRGEGPPQERAERSPRQREGRPAQPRETQPRKTQPRKTQPRKTEPRKVERREGRENPVRDRKPQGERSKNVPTGVVMITGGYETDPRDHGRPVTLIAAALGVKSEVFRQAFSNVKPARGGDPTPARAQANKKVLMDALGKHGITNDRLDTVSNYYRYQPGRGKLWKHTPASAKAIIKDGKVTGFEITNPGSGYMTPPSISVAGHEAIQVKATLEFTKNFQTNGSLKSLTIVE